MIQIPEDVIKGTPEQQSNFLFLEMSRMLNQALSSLKTTSADPDLAVHSPGNNLVFTEINNQND